MLREKSPLRYPGGKACLFEFLREVILKNEGQGGVYFELYAGGAGAALELLYTHVVSKIILNDADFHIYAFWKSILEDADMFIERIVDTPVTLDEWYKQRQIYEDATHYDITDVGFSTFFLNRCNRSGILTKAGPIGGIAQTGNYKIDVRYNKNNLIERIKLIQQMSTSIEVYNCDAISFIRKNQEVLERTNSFMYLDPPYYKKGRSLYLNYYTHADHEELRDTLQRMRHCHWIMSYDNVPEIQDLYANFEHCVVALNYSLQTKRKTTEFCVYSDAIDVNSKFIVEDEYAYCK